MSSDRQKREGSVEQRGLRVCLFTDTLGDVNGVSRFIQNVAKRALDGERELHVITSTRMTVPNWVNVHNVPPRLAVKLPGYRDLEVVWPDRARMAAVARELRPDVVHVSTPGPVGMLGRRIALRRGAPLVGVYHTDFPAYVDHLFQDGGATLITSGVMRWFYAPFARVLVRSEEYARAVRGLGIESARVGRLLPGFERSRFGAERREPAIWARLGVPGGEGTVRVLYAGRVSVEKGLGLMVRVWPRVRAACAARGIDARLVVAGDGPYRAEMERALGAEGASFLGFRHGEELSAIYASSDLFVFPSATDTLGQVVMEAQASGLAALVSDRGGPREIVEDGRTGVVVRAGDDRLWARTIEDLACDGARRRTMGDAGSARMDGWGMERSFEAFWEEHESVGRPGRACCRRSEIGRR